MDTIGERIRERLKAMGMSQKDLAAEMGMTDVSISRYINGKRIPKATKLRKLAKVLGVTSEYLLDAENDESPVQEHFRVVQIIRRNTKTWTKAQKREIIVNLILGDEE